jgi:hypothetical protein
VSPTLSHPSISHTPHQHLNSMSFANITRSHDLYSRTTTKSLARHPYHRARSASALGSRCANVFRCLRHISSPGASGKAACLRLAGIPHRDMVLQALLQGKHMHARLPAVFLGSDVRGPAALFRDGRCAREVPLRLIFAHPVPTSEPIHHRTVPISNAHFTNPPFRSYSSGYCPSPLTPFPFLASLTRRQVPANKTTAPKTAACATRL